MNRLFRPVGAKSFFDELLPGALPQAIVFHAFSVKNPLGSMAKHNKMPSVAFICTANRCRSVMAHAIFVAEAQRRSLPVETYSAGTFDFRGAPPIHETTTTCEMHQTPAPEEVATFVRDLPLDSIDRFLVMERHHRDALVYEFGVPRERVSLLGDYDPQQRGSEIDDPFGHGGPTYTQCYARLRDCVINYLDTTEELSR